MNTKPLLIPVAVLAAQIPSGAGNPAAPGQAANSKNNSQPRPNVVLMIGDDTTFSDLEPWGSTVSKTPNITRLATEGLKFNRCYQTTAMSSPTRHALYTGLYPVHSGAYPNHTYAYDNVRCFVQYFRDGGYRTALYGKEHVEPHSVFAYDYLGEYAKVMDYTRLENYINDSGDQPFFMVVASHEAHSPWTLGDPSQWDVNTVQMPPIYVDTPETRESYVRYLAEVNLFDYELGQVLDVLERTGVADNTIFVYVSEQGNELPFAKWTCYDMGLHSGMIVRWPGHIKAGTTTEALVEYVDVVPTMLDMCGVTYDENAFDGRSFAKVLKGKSKTHKQYSYGLQTSRGIYNGPIHYGIRSVFDGQYRYIWNLTPEVKFQCYTQNPKNAWWASWKKAAETDEFAREMATKQQTRPGIELYDQISDPWNMHNLAEDPAYAPVIERLDAELHRWMDSQGDRGQETEEAALGRMWKNSPQQQAGKAAKAGAPQAGKAAKSGAPQAGNEALQAGNEALQAGKAGAPLHTYSVTPVDFSVVKVNDAFWAPKIERNRTETIPSVLDHCWSTGRVGNFQIAAGSKDPSGWVKGRPGNDSDVYKTIEGVANSLMTHPDPELEKRADEVIDAICSAQEEDGYLYTIYTARDKHNDTTPAGKFCETHLRTHELYCAGHLFEAAVAYYNATGKRKLLDAAIRVADLICESINADALVTFPGHQEIELALCKLYLCTGNEKYLSEAKFLLDSRGTVFADVEGADYRQADRPITEQDTLEGHCVRALYMCAGIADVAAYTGEAQYAATAKRLWKDYSWTQVYITGGVGPGNGRREGFGEHYCLENEGSYNETCAGIAGVLFSYRMYLLTGDAKFMDGVERALYNNVLSGIGFDAVHYFYPNRLESAKGEQRKEWFPVPCCPTNICRFIPQVPGLIYAQKDNAVYVNLYASSEATMTIQDGTSVRLVQEGGMPWSGDVRLTVHPSRTDKFPVRLRVPGWARELASNDNELYRFTQKSGETSSVRINGEKYSYDITDKGYIAIVRQWSDGDVVELSFPMKSRLVKANDAVSADAGKVAVQRGPFIYCAEGIDQTAGCDVMSAIIPADAAFSESFDDDLGDGAIRLDGPLSMIPYFCWANRGKTPMRVWFPSMK